MLGDVRLPQSTEDAFSFGSFGLGITCTEIGGFAAVPLEPGIVRVTAIEWGRPAVDHNVPVTLDELQAAICRVLGEELPMSDPRWLSRTNDSACQAECYRDGRVLLAGDAAHVHFAFGGQGLNMGLQDAANLGWKLAATVQGWAPDGLLDGYHTERYPVGRAVMRGSGALLRLTLAQSQATRAVRWLLANVVGWFGSPPALVSRVVSGIGIAYAAPRGEHRLAGRRAPDVRLASQKAGETRLYEILRGGRFVLLTPAGAGVAIGRRWTGRVDLATAAHATLPMVLVRPDGYVAWATDDTAPASRDAALRTALTRWCCHPTGIANGTDRSASDSTGGNANVRG